MKISLSRGLKEALVIAAINALAISAFVSFMTIYPHYYDRWPEVYFDEVAPRFLGIIARIILFVFLIELVPLFLLRRLVGESRTFTFRVLLPSLLDAILFGAVAGSLAFYGSHPNWAWTGPDIYFREVQFFFFFRLHFIVVFVIEFIIRAAAFIVSRSADRAPKKKG